MDRRHARIFASPYRYRSTSDGRRGYTRARDAPIPTYVNAGAARNAGNPRRAIDDEICTP